MALDGWTSEVVAISQATPNVLVREIVGGALVSWVLTSGLTQEEAGLIQPGYLPPTGVDARFDELVVPGASFERDGFRYGNFDFQSSSTGGISAPTAGQLGVIYGVPLQRTDSIDFLCYELSSTCVPRLDTLWIGYDYSTSELFRVALGQSLEINIAYDVLPVQPNLGIAGGTTGYHVFFGGFGHPLYVGPVYLATSIAKGIGAGITFEAENGIPDAIGSATGLLVSPPALAVRVSHTVRIADEATFGGFSSTILRTVPEPGSGALLVLTLGAMGLVRRRQSAR